MHKNNNSDTNQIINISQSIFFTNSDTSADYCPKTVDEMKLFFDIVDKTNIMNNYDLEKLINFSAMQLDALYTILRLVNKISNKFIEYAIKKIFMVNLSEIICELQSNECLQDQMTECMDFFICDTIKKQGINMDVHATFINYMSYLEKILKDNFFSSILKNTDSLILDNENKIRMMVNDFVLCAKSNLEETNETLKSFLTSVMTDSSMDQINNIMISISNHFELDKLYNEECMEIEIYGEQLMQIRLDQKQKQNKINEIIDIHDSISKIGYELVSETTYNIFDIFKLHNFVKKSKDLMKLIAKIMKLYENYGGIIDIKNSITLKKYYNLISSTHQKKISYAKMQSLLNNNNYTSCCADDLIIKLVSKIFNVTVDIICDTGIHTIDNTCIHEPKTVTVYRKNLNYYLITEMESEFIPCFKKVKSNKLSFDNIISNSNIKYKNSTSSKYY